jgi:peptide/nickel transport system permease protein
MNPQLRRQSIRARGKPPVDLGPPKAEDAGAPILDVRGLKMEYRLPKGAIRAVDGVDFTLPRGGSLGVVGESGCGKSSLGAALLQVMAPNAAYTAGDVSVAGRPILKDGQVVRAGSRDAVMDIRWTRVSIIFQSAMNALNPVLTVRQQLMEAYRLHRPAEDEAAAVARIEALFDLIGIPRRRMTAYPHELSGGMRQRVMIACAIATGPEIIVADEPTTGLDVTVQAEIMKLLKAIQAETGVSVILVSHDLALIDAVCDRITIMHAGTCVETGTVAQVARPRHPYTAALNRSRIELAAPGSELRTIRGRPPAVGTWAPGCRFADRCDGARPDCRTGEHPRLAPVADGHMTACPFPDATEAAA